MYIMPRNSKIIPDPHKSNLNNRPSAHRFPLFGNLAKGPTRHLWNILDAIINSSYLCERSCKLLKGLQKILQGWQYCLIQFAILGEVVSICGLHKTEGSMSNCLNSLSNCLQKLGSDQVGGHCLELARDRLTNEEQGNKVKSIRMTEGQVWWWLERRREERRREDLQVWLINSLNL